MMMILNLHGVHVLNKISIKDDKDSNNNNEDVVISFHVSRGNFSSQFSVDDLTTE